MVHRIGASQHRQKRCPRRWRRSPQLGQVPSQSTIALRRLLEPVLRSSAANSSTDALADDTLEAELAGVAEHHIAGLVDMLVEVQCSACFAQELRELSLLSLDPRADSPPDSISITQHPAAVSSNGFFAHRRGGSASCRIRGPPPPRRYAKNALRYRTPVRPLRQAEMAQRCLDAVGEFLDSLAFDAGLVQRDSGSHAEARIEKIAPGHDRCRSLCDSRQQTQQTAGTAVSAEVRRIRFVPRSAPRGSGGSAS